MTNVSRRKFIKTGAAVGLSAGTAAVATPAIAQAMPEIKWRQTTSWPKSLDTLYGGADLIGKRVAALTDNKFQIQTFAGGEIVPGLQVVDAVQNGTVECGHTAPTRCMILPANPPSLNFKPFRSSIFTIGLRNQPPI
jgi:TRAP-type mannitol/chloroaromatic compound transport system substrate-binding protein